MPQTACTATKKERLRKLSKELINLQYECRKDARKVPVILDNVARDPGTGKFESMNDVKISKLKSGDDGYERKLAIRDEMDKARGIKKNRPRKARPKRARSPTPERERSPSPEPQPAERTCTACRKTKTEKDFPYRVKDGLLSKVCKTCSYKRKKNS